jgi:uncharacterized protein (TIGR02145 family)
MRKWLFILLAVWPAIGQSQRQPGNAVQMIPQISPADSAHFSARAKEFRTAMVRTAQYRSQKAGDLYFIYPGNWENATRAVLFNAQGGGYVVGTNNYGDIAKAQVFENDKPLDIHAVMIWIGAVKGQTGTVHFRIWDFQESPGQVLATKSMPVSEIIASDDLDNAMFIEFSPPVRVTQNFMAGVDMKDIGGSAIGLVSSDDGDGGGLGLSWEQWSDHSWHTFLDPTGWNLDLDIAIFPAVSQPEEDPPPVSDSLTVLSVSQRTDGSGLVDVEYALEGQGTQYFIGAELSPDGGPSFLSVNPAWVSGDYWPVNPGPLKKLTFDASLVSPSTSSKQALVKLTARRGLIVVTDPMTNVTASSATFGGQVLSDGGAVVSSRGLVYGTVRNPTMANTVVQAGSGTGPFSRTVDGLSPQTTYYVRAFATNTSGTVYGNQETFTTLAEGPILVGGPGGSTFVLPRTSLGRTVQLAPTQTPAAGILRSGQQSVSTAIRIVLNGHEYLGGSDEYEIRIPVTAGTADPGRLRLNILAEEGEIVQIPGQYDPATKIFSVMLRGLKHGWVMGVVSGSEILTVHVPWKAVFGEDKSMLPWPALDLFVSEVSQSGTRLTEAQIEEIALPAIRDAMITLQSTGFRPPELDRNEGGNYIVILDNAGNSAYTPSNSGPTGRIVIGYKHFAPDPANPSTQNLQHVFMHELFHAVQYAYGRMESLPGWNFYMDELPKPYKEGTATVLGNTYFVRGAINQGSVEIRNLGTFDGPHDPGHTLDLVTEGSFYNRQDFFGFMAKRYFSGDQGYMHDMFEAMLHAVNNDLGAVVGGSLLRRALRRGMHNFLTARGSSLPQVYVEFVHQRLYAHEPDYLLRPGENPLADTRFGRNRLAVHLLQASQRHKNWLPKSQDKLDYDAMVIPAVKPLSSAAISMHLPASLPAASRPDSITISVQVPAWIKIKPVSKEEGIRVMVIRATDELGMPVVKDPFLTLDGTKDRVRVSIKDGVTHLIFLVMNAYVADEASDITFGVIAEDKSCPSTFTDPRNGKTYPAVLIGDRCWTGENMAWLPGVDSLHHYSLTDPRYYVYDYNGQDVAAALATANYKNYGVLYNFPAARNACPAGWRLPEQSDWSALMQSGGGPNLAGGHMKSTRTAPDPHPRWNSPNAGATNQTGFSGLPGGTHYPDWDTTESAELGESGYWWSSTQGSETNKYRVFQLSHNAAAIYTWALGFYTYEAVSVRCIKE